MPRMPRLILKLDDDLIKLLDAQVDALSRSQAAREFGVVIDRQVAARVALIRGLAAMSVSVVSVTSEDRDSVVTPPKPTPKPEPAEVALDENGRVLPPEGWVQFRSSEQVPPEQSDVHEYYTKQGWGRWYGTAGNEAISFYWCDNQAHQTLDPWEKPDARGKVVVVQTTPWGPGHIVPHGWSGV